MALNTEINGWQRQNGVPAVVSPKAIPGRPKGSANKLTANFKQVVQSTLETMGLEGLDKWAQENPDAFFKVAARLIPQQREVSGPDGGPIRRREVREYSTDELYALLEAGGEADSR